MRVDFTEVMVQTFPKGFENWKFYRCEYGGHAEQCLFEVHIWLPPSAKIKDLTNLFVNWQKPILEIHKEPQRKLLRNRVKCKKCGTVIESRWTHDFVSCECGSIFVDGGLDYMRMGGNLDNIEDLSEWKKL